MVKTCFNCKHRTDQKVTSRCYKCWNHPDKPGWESIENREVKRLQLEEQTKEGRFHGEQDS